MNRVNLPKIKRANDPLSIGLGVIGWKSFGELNGLLLSNTNSVHTFFVKFPLDLVFLDKGMRVLQLTHNLKPLRISPIVWQAKYVLEMPTGSIEKFSIEVGNQIDLV